MELLYHNIHSLPLRSIYTLTTTRYTVYFIATLLFLFVINIFSVAFPHAWPHISVLHPVGYGDRENVWVFFSFTSLVYMSSYPQWDQNNVPLFGLRCVIQTTATISTDQVETFLLVSWRGERAASVSMAIWWYTKRPEHWHILEHLWKLHMLEYVFRPQVIYVSWVVISTAGTGNILQFYWAELQDLCLFEAVRKSERWVAGSFTSSWNHFGFCFKTAQHQNKASLTWYVNHSGLD